MRQEAKHQATQMADLVFTIVATEVIDQPGCIAINIIKDRGHGKTGLKIVQADFLIGRTVFA